MASTKQLIDAWTDSGLPRAQATAMALALDEHLEAKVVDKATLRSEMADLKRELAELKAWVLLRVIGLVIVQLGLFRAITKLG